MTTMAIVKISRDPRGRGLNAVPLDSWAAGITYTRGRPSARWVVARVDEARAEPGQNWLAQREREIAPAVWTVRLVRPVSRDAAAAARYAAWRSPALACARAMVPPRPETMAEVSRLMRDIWGRETPPSTAADLEAAALMARGAAAVGPHREVGFWEEASQALGTLDIAALRRIVEKVEADAAVTRGSRPASRQS